MQLVNEFLLPVPRSSVWAILTSPEIAVSCMPGAALTDQLDERTFKASVSLKVGPVKLQFAGDGQLANLAEDQSYGEMSAKGSDSKGRGGFKTDMKFYLSEVNGQTQVRVETELTLTGSVAQYGRGAGIVKEVAGALTQEFTRNVQDRAAAMPQTEVAQPGAASTLSASVSSVASENGPAQPATEVPEAKPINLPQLIVSALVSWIRSLFFKKP